MNSFTFSDYFGDIHVFIHEFELLWGLYSTAWFRKDFCLCKVFIVVTETHWICRFNHKAEIINAEAIKKSGLSVFFLLLVVVFFFFRIINAIVVVCIYIYSRSCNPCNSSSHLTIAAYALCSETLSIITFSYSYPSLVYIFSD